MPISSIERPTESRRKEESDAIPAMEEELSPERFKENVNGAKEIITSGIGTEISSAKLSFEKVSAGSEQDNEDLIATTATALDGIWKEMLVLGGTTTEEIDAAAQAVEVKEGSTEISAEIADSLIKEALDQVHASFNAPENDEQRLDFHNTHHTESVVDRTEKIMRAMKQSERDILLAKIIAAGHDIKQEYGVDHGPDGKQMRKRSGESKDVSGNVLKNISHGTNEKESAHTVQKMMEDVNKKQGRKIFSSEDFATAEEAIEATVPGWDNEAKTVMQPKLTQESSPIARALALADLGEAGMDPHGYLAGGDALFSEENLEMRNLDFSKLDNAKKEAYRKRMLGWSASQEGFAQGRQQRLEKEIDGLSNDEKVAIKKLFTEEHFSKSIQGAKQRAEERTRMTVEELYKNMGFASKISTV